MAVPNGVRDHAVLRERADLSREADVPSDLDGFPRFVTASGTVGLKDIHAPEVEGGFRVLGMRLVGADAISTVEH